MHEPDTISFFSGSMFAIIGFIIAIFYCWSLYSALKLVPTENQLFPDWLIWLILIPLVGIIFSWMMVPFGIPRSFEKHFADNEAAKAKAKTLFGIGLAQMILITISFIPMLGLLTAIAALVLWIIYWVKVVSFKNEFLVSKSTAE